MDKLERFEIAELLEGFVMTIEAAGGAMVEVEVSPEQFDAIVDAFDQLLDDEDEDEVEAPRDGPLDA